MALDETRTAGETGHLSDHNSLHDFYNAAVAAGAFDESTGTYKNTYGNTATGSGDGATTTFLFAHGLNFTPMSVVVSAGSSAARGDFHVTFDATNITVTYAAAPATGTGNLTWNWMAAK